MRLPAIPLSVLFLAHCSPSEFAQHLAFQSFMLFMEEVVFSPIYGEKTKTIHTYFVRLINGIVVQ